ncbi:NAD(P)-binding domain-containing protein [Paenibacillus sp. GSMTC-2017]|uniref:NADPH-dependent F420 reductase n=1 Tax=Paenibacillus sp. GSMTC-2017 TaxID=2794350 RepID=UPI0018D8DF9E|nr:NAD(P)-binding domain-containing protein [Paenibacillus sp. GSMTC-2017]MBH5319466.1 NAD(P)-binding domain-containing protein [Paenibacillus sp. GSMTC-2017]
MNIGIIGSGNVGKTLGKGLIQAGYPTLISSRDPLHSKHYTWKQEVDSNGDIVSFNKVIRFGDIIILALPWSCVEDVLETIDHQYMKNKIVIDVTNAVTFSNGPRLLYETTSAGETVQQLLPLSHVVKTLNTVSDKVMVRPSFEDGTPTMFVSGNDNHSKKQVEMVLNHLGWSDIIDLGDIRQSRLQESIMVACVISEIQRKVTASSFSLLTI